MNKKNIFTTGALLLAVVGGFAFKAMKASTPSAIGYTVSGVCHALLLSGVPTNFTTATGGSQAAIISTGGLARNVWTLSNGTTCGKAVFFKS